LDDIVQNFFDTAEIYGNGVGETILGKAIKSLKCRRSEIVVSTKIIKSGSKPNDHGLSMKHIIEGLDASLERLDLKYVDLVFCHRPDPTTPIEETVRAMTQLIHSGKAFYWGTSNWPPHLILEAYYTARQFNLIPPTMEQAQYNMFQREKVENGYLGLYDIMGLGITTFSPLAYGILTGKYNDGIPEDSRLAMDNFKNFRNNVLEKDEGKEKISKENCWFLLQRNWDVRCHSWLLLGP